MPKFIIYYYSDIFKADKLNLVDRTVCRKSVPDCMPFFYTYVVTNKMLDEIANFSLQIYHAPVMVLAQIKESVMS